MTLEKWGCSHRLRMGVSGGGGNPQKIIDKNAPDSPNHWDAATKFKMLLSAAVAIGVILFSYPFRPAEGGKRNCYVADRDSLCYSTERNPSRLYGTKTAYNVSAEPLPAIVTEFKPAGCEPVQLYLVMRHAARYPDADDIVEMSQRLPQLKKLILDSAKSSKGHLCNLDTQQLEEWQFTMKPEDDNNVSDSGKWDTMAIAQRFKAKFASLLDRKYSPENITIGYTSRIRTRVTAQAFLEGLFGPGVEESVQWPAPKDDILQFHQECAKLLKEQGYIKETPKEVAKFERGQIMNDTLADLSWRLGFEIAADDMDMMLKICSYEYAIRGRSPWCAVFSTQSLRVLDFVSDLDDYYKDAYGLKRNYEQACPLVRDLMDSFGVATKGAGPASVLYFTHAGAIKKIIARFGIAEDRDELEDDDFCKDKHKWRSSYLSPFNSNLAFVLQRCRGRYFISTFLQEKPINVKGCKNELCPLETFVSKYQSKGGECDLRQICKL